MIGLPKKKLLQATDKAVIKRSKNIIIQDITITSDKSNLFIETITRDNNNTHTQEFTMHSRVRYSVNCSCEYFRYYCAHALAKHNASKQEYLKYGTSSKNPYDNPSLCKHLVAILKDKQIRTTLENKYLSLTDQVQLKTFKWIRRLRNELK